jgi:putative hydrolase of the HAD superfamily
VCLDTRVQATEITLTRGPGDDDHDMMGDRVSNGGITVVLFDLGGVLVENRGEQVLGQWIRDPGEAQRMRDTWLTSANLRAFESGRLSVEAFADAFTEEMALPMGRERFVEVFSSLVGALLPGAPGLLARLRGRYTLASLSNTNALHWPRLASEHGIDALFDKQFLSHVTGKLKPDREAFQQVVDFFGCSPGSILFLDDHQVNVTEAEAYGMNAVRVCGLREAEAALEEEGLL